MSKIPCEHDQSSDIANYIGGGIRYKYFNVTIKQTFAANNTYTFSTSDFGLGNILPKGFVIATIGGDQTNDYSGILRASGSNILYRCMSPNTECIFRGIAFY